MTRSGGAWMKSCRSGWPLWLWCIWAVFAGVAQANCTVETVQGGQWPFTLGGPLVVPGERWLIAADGRVGDLRVVDPERGLVVAAVATGVDAVAGLAATPDGQRLYVSDLFNPTVAEIDITAEDPATWQASRSLAVEGATASGLGAVVATASRLHVVDFAAAGVATLDRSSGELLHRATAPSGACAAPSDLALIDDRLWLACEGSNRVVVFDAAAGSHLATVAVGDQPRAIAAGPSGSGVVVASSGAAEIALIDPATFAVTTTLRDPNLLSGPVDLVQRQGDLWALDLGARLIRLVYPGPVIDAGACSGLGSRPTAVVAGEDGSLWVSHANGVDRVRLEEAVSLAIRQGSEDEATPRRDLLVAPGESFTVEVRGGRGPFELTGSGGLTAESPADGRIWQVTAPRLEGVQALYVEDQGSGETLTLPLRVGLPLVASPTDLELELGGQSSLLSVSGGYPPYRWASERGLLSTASGRYVIYTPQIAGGDRVTVRDSSGSETTIKVTVTQSGVQVSPAVAVLEPGESRTFKALGGSGYRWAAPLGGRIDQPEAAEITFTAPSETGRFDLLLEEVANGQQARVVVYVVNARLAISPERTSLERGDNQIFTVGGGRGPYQWTVEEGDLGATSGLSVPYTAPERSTQTRLTVRDAGGRMAVATIEVGRDRRISPVAPVIALDEQVELTLSGAVGEVAWGSSDGTVTPTASGASWSPPGRSGRFVVWATDGSGVTAQSTVRVVDRLLKITPASGEVTQGEPLGLRVSGGGGPYVWSAEAGSLSTSDGALVSWIAPEWLPEGPVAVEVMDAGGALARAELTVVPREEARVWVNVPNDCVAGGDTLAFEVRGAAPAAGTEWDLYVAAALPDGVLLGFDAPGQLVDPMGTLRPWRDRGVVAESRWQRPIELELPIDHALPTGPYALYAALVPAGEEPLTAIAAGRARWDQGGLTVDDGGECGGDDDS